MNSTDEIRVQSSAIKTLTDALLWVAHTDARPHEYRQVASDAIHHYLRTPDPEEDEVEKMMTDEGMSYEEAMELKSYEGTEWSEWFNWSGGKNPVMGCRIQCTLTGERTPEKAVFAPYHANSYCWGHSARDDSGNITRYRVLLSSIPDGYSLMDGMLVEDLPEGGWQA